MTRLGAAPSQGVQDSGAKLQRSEAFVSAGCTAPAVVPLKANGTEIISTARDRRKRSNSGSSLNHCNEPSDEHLLAAGRPPGAAHFGGGRSPTRVKLRIAPKAGERRNGSRHRPGLEHPGL